jgi:hypothetical protein
MACLPHQRHPTGTFNFIEQHLACLHIRDDRAAGMLLQHISCQQHQQLIAKQNGTRVIDQADAVRITIKGDADIRVTVCHFTDQLLQIRRDRWIWVVCRKGAVDGAIQHNMLAGQSVHEASQHLAGGSVTVVPYHLQHAVTTIPIGEQAADIILSDVD